MSWSAFYLIVSGLIALVLFFVALPFLRRKNHAQVDSLTNTQIVKQRLQELEREQQEGLISELDMRQAADELKVALVDETNPNLVASGKGDARLPLLVGAVLALVAGIWVYASVNQIAQVARATQAIEALPQLSEQLANGNGQNLTEQDIISLSLAIRQRLRSEPDDDTGWMYLGRLMLTVGQEVQAIEAIDKAVKLAPDNSAYRITLAQALMTTGEVNNLNRAQSLLLRLLAGAPENDNLALMMAVVSAQLGDLDNLTRYYQQVEGKLPADSDIGQRLAIRKQELALQAGQVTLEASSTQEKTTELKAKTGFSITVDVTDEARAALPASGFLIVFAQDAESQNRMPAAVVKLPLQRFPVTVKLDTENAMLAQYTLAMLSTVTLTARVSTDGDVAISPGEWEGSMIADVIPHKISDINLLIEKELL